MKWNTTDPAPKGGDTILACFGFPWVSIAVWNEPSQQWCATLLEVDLYENKWNDVSISHEYFDEKELEAWMPLPEVYKERTDG